MFELNLYLTLKKHKGNIRRMLMNIGNNNPKWGTKFAFDNNILRQQRSWTLETKFIIHCETNQCCGFSTQASSFYDNHLVFYLSLLEPYHAFTILGRIHDPPPPIESDGKQEYEIEDILDLKIFNHQFQCFIHWHGSDVNERNSEPIKSLSNVIKKVHEFHQRYSNKFKFVPCRTHCHKGRWCHECQCHGVHSFDCASIAFNLI
jgi:hypothetical protein